MAPTVQEEPLTGYKIRYWESDKDVSQANDTTVYIGSYDFKLEATISDLSPGKTYYLRVLAFSQGGEGKLEKIMFLKGNCNSTAEPIFPFLAEPTIN